MARLTYLECGCQVDEDDEPQLYCTEHTPKPREPSKPRKPKPDPIINKPINNNIEVIIEKLKKLKVKPNWLDEPVHNTASEIACRVNNTGMSGQVDFLLKSGWTGNEIVGFFNYVKGESNDS